MTRTFAKRLIPLCILMLGVTLFSACSRQQLYDTAIDYERGSADLTEHTIMVDGRKIAYLSNEPHQGAQTIVMVHGFSANKDNWLRMSAELSDKYNIYAIDLPGHGDSNQDIDRAYGYRDQVGYVHNILEKLDLKKVHMIGNSMGGAITALYAATYPGQIKTASLLDPAGVFKYESKLLRMVEAGENPLVAEKPGDYEQLIDFVMEQKPFVPWPIYSVLEEKAIARQAINKKIFKEIRNEDEAAFVAALPDISAPTLIVWGREDRAVNYQNAEVFQSHIPDARTVILDDVGHVPMIEVPEKTAHLLDSLIQGKTIADSQTKKIQ